MSIKEIVETYWHVCDPINNEAYRCETIEAVNAMLLDHPEWQVIKVDVMENSNVSNS